MSGYYYATPFGRNIGSLARSVTGGDLATRQAQLGLMQSRQELIDQQELTQVANQELLRQRRDEVRQRMRAAENETTAQGDLANIFTMMPGAPLTAQPVPPELLQTLPSPVPAGPPPTQADLTQTLPAPVPTGPLPNLQQPLGADYTLGKPGLADAVTGPVPYTPSVPIAPRTRQELAAEAYAQAVRAGPKIMGALPKLFLGYGGAMDATAPDLKNLPYGPQRITSLAEGAGEPYSQSPMGFAEHEARMGREAAARDATQQRGQDVRATTAQANQAARLDAKGGGTGKAGKTTTVSIPQQKKLEREFAGALLDKGIDPTPEQLGSLVAAVDERVKKGENFTEVKNELMTNMTRQTAPAEKRFLRKDKPATHEFVPPTRGGGAPAAPAPGKPAPAAAPAAAPQVAKSVSELPPAAQRVAGKTRVTVNGKTHVWNGKGWQPE